MAQLTITYKSKRTLEMLLDLAKYFDFTVSRNEAKAVTPKRYRGISVVDGDSTVDTSELNQIFTGRNLDAGELRASQWERRK